MVFTNADKATKLVGGDGVKDQSKSMQRNDQSEKPKWKILEFVAK